MKRVLITGITGFVGYFFAKFLSNQGKVEIFGTRFTDQEIFPIEDFIDQEKIHLVTMDTTRPNEVSTVIDKVRPEVIIHLAAQSNVAISFKEPQLTFNVNAIGTLNLYESILKFKLDPIIISVGSAGEYGITTEADLPIDESTPLNPMDPYGASKVSMFYLSRLYFKAYKLRIIHTRAFNHFGPRQKPTFAIPSFCRQIAEIEKRKSPPEVYVGNLDTIRDFLDVRDVVKAYWLLVQKGKPGEVYNIASGKGQKMGDILNFLLSFAAIPITIRQDKVKFRPSDVPVMYGDSTKIQKQTGWKPSIDFKESLKDTLNFWRNGI